MSYMRAKEKIEIIRQYLNYVEEHLDNVHTSWERLKEIDDLAKEDGLAPILPNDFLYWKVDECIRNHDVSKLSAEELVQYAEWFYGAHGKNYDIWDDGGAGEKAHEEAINGFCAARQHHRMNNKHHELCWTADDEALKEWEVHCVCMVIDWMAMGLKFGDTAEEYYNKNCGNIFLPGHGHDMCRKIFERLRIYGECSELKKKQKRKEGK